MQVGQDIHLPELLTELAALGACMGMVAQVNRISDFMCRALEDPSGFVIAKVSIMAGNGHAEDAIDELELYLEESEDGDKDFSKAVLGLISSLAGRNDEARAMYNEVLAYSSDVRARTLAKNGIELLDTYA